MKIESHPLYGFCQVLEIGHRVYLHIIFFIRDRMEIVNLRCVFVCVLLSNATQSSGMY